MTRLWPFLIGLLLCAGCTAPATALDSAGRPRPMLRFRGGPYRVTHYGALPAPGGPSGGLQDEGGVIRGGVCGQDVSYQVRHLGDHVELEGWIAAHTPSRIEVRDQGWRRTLRGNLGAWKVDLGFSRAVLYGRLGPWSFVLGSIGDDLAENVLFPGVTATSDDRHRKAVGLYGRRALWEMPAADQAAVLPLMLTCMQMALMLQGDQAEIEMGFGRPGDDAPLPVRTLISLALPEEPDDRDASAAVAKSWVIRRSWWHYALSMGPRLKIYDR